MSTLPDNHQGPPDRLRGARWRLLLIAAAGEFLLFWLLVFRFPRVMAPLSAALAGGSYLVWRLLPGQERSFREAGYSPADLRRLRQYARVWIFIALYGGLFALYLVLRAG